MQGERRPKRRRKQMHDLSGVGSVGIVARGPLDEYRFNMFMRDLLAEKAKDIFRCKGVLAVHVSSGRHLCLLHVHAVCVDMQFCVSMQSCMYMQGTTSVDTRLCEVDSCCGMQE
jgi:G3E family GTPase